MNMARLKELYKDKYKLELLKELGLRNIMQVPTLEKIVLNVGSKEAVSNAKALQEIVDTLGVISSQKPIKRAARKSIAGFKLRQGMPIGAKVTLRGTKMYEFLDRLINLALPKVRDFQGISRTCDGRGSYNLGIKEWTIFPEIADYDISKKTYGLNVTFHTSAKNDAHALALLTKFGMPFKAA